METSKMLKNSAVRSIPIEFTDLTYQVKVPKQKEKKTVLKGISGTFLPGELTAIMGPSGAGKSSLMNILTGFTKTGVTGTIKFGDAPKARKLCCYIMQDDHFYAWFTVEETMMLAASLKISNESMHIRDRKLLIEQILETLKLTKTKHTRCSRLSGGQKKRLSIALELIDNPAVLFLDEPTTGLDSSSSFDTIKLLQKLASHGRTIVCTIHQPSSNIYSLFNQIYVMSQGYCTYQGTPDRTVDYFKSLGLECPAYHNPADFLLECVNGDYGDYTMALAEAAQKPEWRHNYNRSRSAIMASDKIVEANTGVSVPSNGKLLHSATDAFSNRSSSHFYPPPEWVRLWLLIGRCHVQIFRDWSLTHIKLLMHILCAIMIGLLFGDSGSNADKQLSNFGSYLVHTLYLWYTTIMPSVLRFPQEIAIIKKESFNNWYKLRTFYLASLITSTPVHIILSTVYITITYFMTDQPLEVDRFVKVILSSMMVTICADGLGIFLGTILNPVNGTFVGAVTTCFMMIFSGFLILLTHMSDFMRMISYVSPIRYGLENMVLAMYSNNRQDTICPDDVLYCHFKNAATVLKSFGMENGNYGMNLGILVLQLVIYKSCAYFTLKRQVKRQ
ncbi:ATP-binding cassette sub-family G member 1-like [Musca vetustissima]|uniref:ATP-binding cassette sub-family G member 1-like n=1 Tax=Musca vetustissima TaxID=27455 RepID=UPI002AB6969D|nr:ATP-binding cassette sub-family G member 1-like [Musca vetustissima]XP_061395411.1 ATP-binding cassette sub-family G member 1-like [Musca vetustissima]